MLFREYKNSMTICLAEIVIGLMFLINPFGFTKAIVTGLGLFVLLFGAIQLLSYFSNKKMGMEIQTYLVLGVAGVCIGVFLMAGSGWIVATLSIVILLYGIFMLVSGISKLKWAWDLRKLDKRWMTAAASALLTILAAVIIIVNPFSTTMLLWRFLGVVLLVEAVTDLLAMWVAQR